MPKLRTAFTTLTVLLTAASLKSGSSAQTPTLTTLHSFAGKPSDGAYPYAGVTIGSGGVLYGTTISGGGHGPGWNTGDGIVFSLAPPVAPGGVWTEAIYSFSDEIGDRPQAGVAIGSDGILYGTTYHSFTVFALKPPPMEGGQWMQEVLGGGAPVLIYPEGTLAIGNGGVLYGTSYEGGDTFDEEGDVFSVTPPVPPGGAWTTTAIRTLSTGSFPESGVAIGGDGVLYGTTSNGNGEVYSLTPPATPGGTWTETSLHAFAGAPEDGGSPGGAGVVVGTDKVLYGTSFDGGTGTACRNGCGTVYSLTPPTIPGGAWTEAVLYNFAGADDGQAPTGVVIGPDKVLYGTTSNGGSGTSCYDGCGTVFSLTPPADPGGPWTEKILHDFTGPDGANPGAGVALGTDGGLYGTTVNGGSGTCGCGTVFQLK